MDSFGHFSQDIWSFVMKLFRDRNDAKTLTIMARCNRVLSKHVNTNFWMEYWKCPQQQDRIKKIMPNWDKCMCHFFVYDPPRKNLDDPPCKNLAEMTPTELVQIICNSFKFYDSDLGNIIYSLLRTKLVDGMNNDILMWACEIGHRDIANYMLLHTEIDVFFSNDFCRRFSIINRHREIYNLLENYITSNNLTYKKA